MTRGQCGIWCGLQHVAGVEGALADTLHAASDEVAHSECLDEEDRSEIYAILHAISGETAAHRQAVEQLTRRFAEDGAHA